MLNYTYSKKYNKLKVRKNNKGVKIFAGIFGVLISLTILTQLYTMSVFATKGEDVTRLENKRNELVKSNKILNDEIAKSQNQNLIDQKSQELGYIDIDIKDVNYIEIE